MRQKRDQVRAEHLRDMSWECRLLAAGVGDPGVRVDLLVLAQRFERLADMAILGGRPPRPPRSAPLRASGD